MTDTTAPKGAEHSGPTFRDTPLADVAPAVERARAKFLSQDTKDVRWRIEQLTALENLIVNEQGALFDAVYRDVRKPRLEFFASEIALTLDDIRTAKRNVQRWSRPEPVSMPLAAGAGAWTKIHHDPYGTCLIIGAWNYPVLLTLCPLVGAIAAGNTAVLKPSELTPHSAAAIEAAVAKYLDPDAFPVVQGGVAQTTELLNDKFDLIFFTGSPAVGRIVMSAAAKNLTPVVLELGGKSPAIVTADADIASAARRIAWGKFFNAGQTCIGVDYVLVEDSVKDQFLDLVLSSIRRFYGPDPRRSPDLARIVNGRNLDRLLGLLDGQELLVGGEFNREERYLAPTVIVDPDRDSPLMKEEIFGPIMPVISFSDLDTELDRLARGDKPLACYVFSSLLATQRRVLDLVSSGGACVNDTLTHGGLASAPFGGVGNSGMGAYHGKDGYLAFTHRKTVLTRTTKFDIPFRYPPYTGGKERVLRALL